MNSERDNWQDITPEDATEEEILLVLKISGRPEWMDEINWRRNLRACAKEIRKHVSKIVCVQDTSGSKDVHVTTGCPQCGRKDLRVLTWRTLGIAETTLGCWDCSWATYPDGVTPANWQQIMETHKRAMDNIDKGASRL